MSRDGTVRPEKRGRIAAMGFAKAFAMGFAIALAVGAAPARPAAAQPTPESPSHAPPQVTFEVEVGARSPAPSPDGSALALSVLGDIFVMPIAGGKATPVTRGESWDRHPAWSPDGRFLAYSEHLQGGSRLLLKNMETGLTQVVFDTRSGPAGGGEILQVDFDSAGDWIYFVRQMSQYDAHLWRVQPDGSGREQLTFTQGWHEWSFALSPDGTELMLETGRYEGTDLFVLDLESRRPTRLTDTPERETSVAWSNDGDTRAWIETLDGVERVMVSTGGAPAREITQFAFGQSELAFEPGGDLIIANARLLHRLDPATGESTPIPVSAPFQRAAEVADDLVITDVRLFAATGGDEAISGAHVVVTDGRITAVGTGPVEAPPGVPVIAGEGRTLMPSLMDNHRHFWQATQGAPLLREGVTSVREPGVAIADGMDFKDAAALGILSAPQIFSTGPLLDGWGGYHPMVDVSIEDPAAAAPLVRALKAQGVDALKAYFLLEPDVLAAVVAEAHALGLPVTGHLGVRTSWTEALDAGIDGFSHIRIWKDFLDPSELPDGRSETLDSGVDPISRMQVDWTGIDVDSPEVTALLERLAETGTAIDPTLHVHRSQESQRTAFDLESFDRARDGYEGMKAFVRRAVEAGVPLLAGTDNVGIHDELESYEAAGVPRARILEAATINGLRWLGVDDDVGTVEVGKRANLLLVDGDPLTDIRALREVELVLKDGVVVFGGESR